MHQQISVTIRVDSFAFRKIINEENAVLIQKNFRRVMFQTNFALGNFGLGEPLCHHYIDCCFVSGHSDITSFRPWSPIAK